QTNMLAVNAGAEAARAGEPGRAFALVVADVLSLTQRSATAARQIKLLTDDASARTGAGALLAGHAGKSILDALAGIKQLADIASDAAASGVQQAREIAVADTALAAIGRARHHDSALLAHAAAAAALRDQADRGTGERAPAPPRMGRVLRPIYISIL
ncbi:MAG: methyl-accepting chemotaxis protein, partial [Telluria sp.]